MYFFLFRVAAFQHIIPTKFWHAFFVHQTHMFSPSNLLDFATFKVQGGLYKSRNSSLCVVPRGTVILDKLITWSINFPFFIKLDGSSPFSQQPHCILTWARWINFKHSKLVCFKIHLNIILLSSLCLPSGLFLSRFLIKSLFQRELHVNILIFPLNSWLE